MQIAFFQKYWFKMTDMDVPPAGGYQFPMVRYIYRHEWGDEERRKSIKVFIWQIFHACRSIVVSIKLCKNSRLWKFATVHVTTMLQTMSSVPRTLRYKYIYTNRYSCNEKPYCDGTLWKEFQEVLDKKFGPSWHVIVDEGFGFEISYETKKMFYMFSAGKGAKLIPTLTENS